MISAVVFDFDGVLADSEALHLRAYQDVLSAEGIGLTREEYYDRYLGFDDEGVFAELGKDLGLPMDAGRIAALVARKGDAFMTLVRNGEVLYPGAVRCVERMAAAFPLGIASGALRHEIETILGQGGLASHFRFIVASGDTPRSKPAPDPYRLAARLHGVAPEACVAIEDSHAGIESARAAGLKCVAVTHTYAGRTLGSANRIVTSLDEITPETMALL
jgi:beta-phosphoglucomutase